MRRLYCLAALALLSGGTASAEFMYGVPAREQRVAMHSLALTGELPHDRYWDAVRVRHDLNPARFDHYHRDLGLLLDRDQHQRDGTLTDCASLFPHNKLYDYLHWRHDLNPARFDHYHPLLGRWLELDDRFDRMVCMPPMLPPTTPVVPPILPPGMPPVVPPQMGPAAAVPEPSSLVLLMTGVAGLGWRMRRRIIALVLPGI